MPLESPGNSQMSELEQGKQDPVGSCEPTSPKFFQPKGPFETVLVVAGTILILGMMGLSVADAMLRSFFNRPIFGSIDMTQMLLAFVVSIAMPICVASGKLISIDSLVDRFPEALQRNLDRALSFLGAITLLFIAWHTFQSGLIASDFGEATMLLQIPFGPAYFGISIGALLSATLLILRVAYDT